MALSPSRLAAKPLIHHTTDALPPHTTHPPTTPSWGEGTKKFLSSSPEAPNASGVFLPANGLSEQFRHSGWAPFRARVEQALLVAPGVSERRVSAFRACGCDAYVEGRCRNPALPNVKEYRIRSTKCHDRFCVPCSQERSARIRHALLQHMAPIKDLSLITLTLRQSDDALSAILDRLTKCLRALRSKPLWRKAVKGGVSIIETKLGTNGQSWHCHFHIVAEASYLHQGKLSALWLAITGDSSVVDIRRVGARSGAVQYITKYITKAADHSIVTSPKHLEQAIVAFTGRRLVSTFGTWRGLQLTERPSDDGDYYWQEGTRFCKEPWERVGSLDEILGRAAGRDAAAIELVRKLRKSARPPPGLV